MNRKAIFFIIVVAVIATFWAIGATSSRYTYSAEAKGNIDLLQTKCSLELYNPSNVTGSTSGATYKTENGTSYFAVPTIPTDYTNINYKVNNKVNNIINQKEIQYYIRVVAEDGSTNMPIEYNVHKYNDVSSKYSLVSGWGYGPFTLQKNTEYTGTNGMFSVEAKYTSFETKYFDKVQKMKVQIVTKLSTGSLKVLSEAPLNMKADWPSYNFTVKASNVHGTVSGESSGIKKYEKQMTVTATHKTGYKFIGWTDGTNTVSSDTSYTFKMPAKNYQLVANFILSSVNNGEIIPFDDNITFIVVKGYKTWKDAESYAQSLGGHLARVDSKEKNELLCSKISSIGNSWIGLTDEVKVGTWRWCWGGDIAGYSSISSSGVITLSGWKYESWRKNDDGLYQEPNNWGIEDYTHLITGTTEWNNFVNDNPAAAGFIVEIHYND